MGYVFTHCKLKAYFMVKNTNMEATEMFHISAVTWTCIWEVLFWKALRVTGCLRDILGFPQSLKANSRVLAHWTTADFFQIINFLLQFDDIQSSY
jgi:hypothetical protein